MLILPFRVVLALQDSTFNWPSFWGEGQEILARVFEKVYRNLESFDPAKASFPTWINAVARNAMIDHIRAWRQPSEATMLQLATQQGRGEAFRDELDGAFLSEARGKVFAAIQSIENEMFRQYLVGKYLFLLTDKVLAEVFEVEESTVRSNIRRAHNAFSLIFTLDIPDEQPIDYKVLAGALRDGAVSHRMRMRPGADRARNAVLQGIFIDGSSATAAAAAQGVSVEKAIEYVREVLLENIAEAPVQCREEVSYGISEEQTFYQTQYSCDQEAMADLLSAAFSTLNH